MNSANAEPLSRIIPLQGGQNFREVGGYPTLDGHILKRGLIWRSAGLHELTPQDIETIHALGIAAIADLRRPSERAHAPTSEALLGRVRALSWDTHGLRDEKLQETLFKANASIEHYFAAILHLYRGIVEEHVVHLRDLYEAIAEGALPILIHCAAGKDRTGVAVGLLLDIIGVRRECVLADYAETEHLLDWDRLTAAAALGTGANTSWLEKLDAEALKLLFRSDERYLAAAFEDIEARFGSTKAFAVERLHLSPSTIERLFERLIES